MPCSGIVLPAPSIDCLDFLLLWDISGATPSVTITNNSTVSNYANLKWWFYVVSPSGVAIYGIDLNTVSTLPTPDVSGVSWTTKTISLPTPFGNAPCGQIEFSPNSPFSVVVFVEDSNTLPFYSYTKSTILVRPNGNTMDRSCGNFGNAAVSMKVDCLNKTITCFDSTNLIYNNILTPLSTSNLWTLVYPQDNSGDIPNKTATSVPNVQFPIGVNSKGYSIYLQEYATYDYGNGVTVKVQYKLFDSEGGLGLTFAINCNTNLCLIQCQMQKFYKQSESCCGTLENAELMNKMTRMNFLFSQALTGIFQPLCGIDVPFIIDEIKKIGKFDDSCDCNCGDGNFGFSNPTGGASTGGCCPVYTNVTDCNTGIAPTNCPNGYFPASVYDPTHATVIGVALSMADVINIINANTAWRTYGTAFDSGNCIIGFYPLNAGAVIPTVCVVPIPGGTGTGTVIVDVLSLCTSPATSPSTCPGSYFPAQIYNPAGTTIIGVASDASSMVGIINANAGWQAYGTAFVVDNCHVGFYPKPGIGAIPEVLVKENSCITTACTNGSQLYPVTILDVCYPGGPPITVASFPFNLYIDFGLGAGSVFVANVASQAAMIAALNAAPSKPASVTFSAGATVDQVIVTNTNCTAYSGTITINADSNSNQFLLFSGNHYNQEGTTSPDISNNEYAMGVASLSILGKLPLLKGVLWHSIRIGYLLIVTHNEDLVHGKVEFYDISNPLMPTLTRTIELNTVVGNNFTGTPESENIATAASPSFTAPTIYDLYFPTDYYAPMGIREIYVVEANTGTIWKIDYLGTGSGVLASFQDDRLIGKCPRILQNNKLYFTQDGDLEQATGQNSTVTKGAIIILDVSDFSSSGVSSHVIIPNVLEYVWAASYDGGDTIYFTGNLTTVAKYSISAGAVTALYSNFLGLGIAFHYRLNTTYFNGYLYMTPQQMPVYIGMIIQVTAFGGSGTINHFQQPPGHTVSGAFNFTPLGNCLGILTSAYIRASGILPQVNIYKVDGTFLSNISTPLTTEEFYNVVPIGGIPNTTPNNYLP